MEVNFPSEITLDPNEITLVQAFGLPSTERTITGSVNTNTNSYLITSACPSYRNDVTSAIVYFSNITNPFYVMTTNTLNIYIYDQNS